MKEDVHTGFQDGTGGGFNIPEALKCEGTQCGTESYGEEG